MSDKWTFRKIFTLHAAVVTAGVALVAMIVMVYYASHKVVVVNDGSENNIEIHTNVSRSWDISLTKWNDKVIEDGGYIKTGNEVAFMLPTSVGEEDITISQRYDLSQIVIELFEKDGSFYERNVPSGNSQHISSIQGEFDGTTTKITMNLDEPCIGVTSYYNGYMFLELKPIDELAKPIIVIDPGHGGTSNGSMVGDSCEKDIVLAIANQVCKLTEGKEYTVLLTRSADIDMSDEERQTVVKTVDANYYIGLHLATDVEDNRVYGLYSVCNTDFYLNDYSNADIADCVLYQTAIETKNRALRIDTMGEDERILADLSIPSTVLYLGYMTNRHEAELLANSEYISMLARGIINAIDKLPK